MDFIDELRTAVLKYPNDHVKTEIVQFKAIGEHVNVGETFEFRVKVTNESYLDMKAVTVRANGTEFADVALEHGLFGGFVVTTAPFDLQAGDQHTTGIFRGKAKKLTGGLKDIANAQINSWDASLNSILNGQSTGGPNEAKLPVEIIPSQN